MSSLDDHPTVKAWRARQDVPRGDWESAQKIPAGELRSLCLAAGADDAGFVSIGHPDLAGQREAILKAFPTTKSIISFSCRLDRESVICPERSVSNLEFKRRGEFVNQTARTIAMSLARHGVRALACTAGYPMELDRFPDEPMWIVSHKTLAVAAGLGQVAKNRLVLHPQFGAFHYLGAVLIDTEPSEYSTPLDFNPCIECQLCVAVCPVGAVAKDGHFDFSACVTHCYRDGFSGFVDWAGSLADSRGRADFRRRVHVPETASLWQSLVVGPTFRTSYCMAVCPAGEEVIGEYLTDRATFIVRTVKPLQAKPERVFVIPGTDAASHVGKRYPHKMIRNVGNGLVPQRIAGFLRGAPILFQRNKSEGLNARFHFRFSGKECAEATIEIRDQTIRVIPGLAGDADVTIQADSETWLGILAKEQNPVLALLTRKLRVRGPIGLFKRFSACFP